MAFDNDEVLDGNDDEDLQNDPVSQMDMQVRTSHRIYSVARFLKPFVDPSPKLSARMRSAQLQ